MIGMQPHTKSDFPRVAKKAQQAGITSLGHAGGAIRLTARRSIRRRKKASPAGAPPHTRRGQLKQAIQYAVEKQHDRVVIGPDEAFVGPSGGAHEHGGRFRRERYPKRPFMRPALQKIIPRLPKMWANSVR